MIVLLDMDGVLVDITGGISNVVGPPKVPLDHWDCWNCWGLTQSEFWSVTRYPGFWSGLEWTRDGRDILDMLETIYGRENIYISTSPSDDPKCYSEKMEWVNRHIPYYSRKVMLGSSKWLMASDGKILVDDSGANVILFRDAGGKAILVPRSWNSNSGLDPLSWIRESCFSL